MVSRWPEATFGLYNEFGECIKLSTSDDSGRVSFRKIPFGRYTIREMEAPDGYLPSKEEISLTIDENHQNSEQPIATVVNQQKRVSTERWIQAATRLQAWNSPC